MLVPRRRLAALLAAGLLAAPASALGQSAGDEQYQDPFAGEGQQQPQGGSDDDAVDNGGGGEEPAVTQAPETAAPAPETAAPAPAPEAAPAESAPGTAAPVTQSAPELPRTGAWTGAIMLAGAILLAGGVVLRVRLREPS
jgi:LPXTG-motif cell wall-anchored protein